MTPEQLAAKGLRVKELVWECNADFCVASGLYHHEYHIHNDGCWGFQEIDDPSEPYEFMGSLEAVKEYVEGIHRARVLAALVEVG